MKKTMLTSGARPNYPKLKPIADLLPEALIVDSGQHYDYDLSKVFYEELGIRKPDYFLNCDKRKETFFSNVIEEFTKVLKKEKPDNVVVFGDIDSTLAFALAAKREKVKLFHVESGLRSHDLEMPEELTRITVDSLSDVRFCTEPDAIKNLKKMGLDGILVGNTMIDTLKVMEDKFPTFSKPKPKIAVLTLHRPANVDNHQNLLNILDKIDEVVDYPVWYFKHPRVKMELGKYGKHIEIHNPEGYIDFHGYMKDAYVVLTDSGGIQEETSAMGVPCVTLRTTTERPITITKGSNVLCKDLGDLEKCIKQAVKKRGKGKDIWKNEASRKIMLYLKYEPLQKK